MTGDILIIGSKIVCLHQLNIFDVLLCILETSDDLVNSF